MANEITEWRGRIQELKRKSRYAEPSRFVATKYLGHLHKGHVNWANGISPENLIELEKHEPCKTCRS
jgi:hypothetical protein